MPAGDITDTLVEKLQIRMENPEGDKFTDTMCIKALDYSHVTIAQLLRPEYLSEFQVKDIAQAHTTGVLALADLTNDPLNYGEGVVMVSDDTTDGFFKRTHPSRQRRYESSFLSGDTTNLLYYILAGSIYGSGYTSTDYTVYYLRVPAEMTTDVDPLLNSFYHNIMLNFAEAQLWTANKDLVRRKVKLEEAYSQIEILNAKYEISLGIGITDLNR